MPRPYPIGKLKTVCDELADETLRELEHLAALGVTTGDKETAGKAMSAALKLALHKYAAEVLSEVVPS